MIITKKGVSTSILELGGAIWYLRVLCLNFGTKNGWE